MFTYLFAVFKDINEDYDIHFNKIEDLQVAKQKSEESKKKEEAGGNEGPIVERKCGKCGNDKMSYATLQLRSADEGQTVFYTCTKCGNKETENS